MDSDKVTLRGALVQILSTFSIVFLACLSGLLFTWPSYNMANFASNETVLAKPMNSLEVSLLGSVMNIGTFVLTPAVGWLMNKIGRKYTIICVGLPFVFAWTLIYITKSVCWVIVGVTVAGCGTAGQAAASIFVSEIAQDSIRGALSSVILIIYFLGALLSYVIGGSLTYTQVLYLQITLSILNIVLLSLLKDSPVYLLQKGREKEAAEALAFYRQKSPKSKQVELELYKIKLQLSSTSVNTDEADGVDPTVTKEFLDKPKQQNLSELQFLKQSPSSKRAFATALIVMCVMALMGNIPMQVFAENLFRDAAPSFNANKCCIWLAVDFVAATLTCAIVVDLLGRKALMIFTCASSAICNVMLGTLIQMHWAPEWFTVLIMYLYNFFFNMGIAVLPFILVGEFFLPEVRNFCSSLTISFGFGLNFFVTLILSPISEMYGFAPLLYGFSVIGFAGAIFGVFYLPETKGLSIDAIQGLFMKKRQKEIES